MAVISDAGSPVISDPGNVLTAVLRQESLEFTVVPGATAFVPALTLSGLDASRFTFIGFLPEKEKDRSELLSPYQNVPSTLIFYSAPHDVNKDLKSLYKEFGNRRAVAVKEITKIHESVYLSTLKNASSIEEHSSNIQKTKFNFFLSILFKKKKKKNDGKL